MSGVGGAKVVSMDLYATIRNKEVLVVDYRNREANGVWIGSNSCLDKQFQNWEHVMLTPLKLAQGQQSRTFEGSCVVKCCFLDDMVVFREKAKFIKLFDMVGRFKATDAGRLRAEYNRLVEGLAQRGNLPISDTWLANPALPDDILKEAVPGNIRRAEHFLSVLRRLVQYLHGRLETENVEKEGPVAFVASINSQAGIDQKMLKFCYDRLHSLMLTLEITDTDEFLHIQTICDFATLVGTYTRGFSIIIEPFDERMPHIPDPVLQLSCHDASLAIKPVFERFQSVVITSGTLSPIDLYPRLLNFNPVVSRSFTMSLTRNCICPMVLTRGSDQLPVSTKFDMRSDPGVVRNYGRLLLEMVSVVPDGIVCFFVSYSYMDGIVNTWNESGILKFYTHFPWELFLLYRKTNFLDRYLMLSLLQEIMQHKLVFIETQDVVETTLALDNYRRACDCGRGAVFFLCCKNSQEGHQYPDYTPITTLVLFNFKCRVNHGPKVLGKFFCIEGAEGICHVHWQAIDTSLKAFGESPDPLFMSCLNNMSFINENVMEQRQAAQCVGRVIRSKADYGMMIFADKSKGGLRIRAVAFYLIQEPHFFLWWLQFLRKMAQPYDKAGVSGRKTLLSEEDLEKMGDGTTNEMLF
ncbi:DNA repair helicase XPD [Vitis vinifera]|uniref:DNA 5'-3' helicase n=1 Tax=Vitis vinifera TaxID=29760 RepID=A0A438F5D1_VITVI|nr:DNA repair helicase XPD [Vitis vinifera]